MWKAAVTGKRDFEAPGASGVVNVIMSNLTRANLPIYIHVGVQATEHKQVSMITVLTVIVAFTRDHMWI